MLKINKTLEENYVDGNMIIFNKELTNAYILRDIEKYLWNEIKKGTTIENLFSCCKRNCIIDNRYTDDSILNDINNFINQLISNGLIIDE